MNPAVFLGPLALLASVSPLLTFLSLWQRKEWRVDRLREHLGREGILRQIFGFLRPAVVLPFALLFAMGILGRDLWIILPVTALALANLAQVTFGRQPRPVWTQKALTLTATSLILTFFIAVFLSRDETASRILFLPILPLLSPLAVFLSWSLWLPVDALLKKRIMARARTLRSAHPDLTVIGIVGCVGKTTTKELLSHLLKDREAIATPEHVNSELGVSQWIIRNLGPTSKLPTTDYHLPTILIAEMGAYRKGEVQLLASIAKPTVGIVTFISNQHMALFGSQEALVESNAELLRALPDDGHAFLNGDSPLIKEIQETGTCVKTIVGTGGAFNVGAYDIEETAKGVRFRVNDTVFQLPLHGMHNVSNVLLAIAAAERVGMKREDIAKKLQSFHPPKHTFSVREEHGVTLLDDTHNASEASVTAAIAWAKGQPAKNKVLLTPGLIELGELHERVHTELGARAASVFNRVVFTTKGSGLTAFERGYGKPVELQHAKTVRVRRRDLLVCSGRMPLAAILRLLP